MSLQDSEMYAGLMNGSFLQKPKYYLIVKTVFQYKSLPRSAVSLQGAFSSANTSEKANDLTKV